MDLSATGKVSKLDAGSKKTWKLHQTLNELQKWSAYLQQSAERFDEELEQYKSTFLSATEAKVYKEVSEGLRLMKKESALLKSRSNRLRGPR
jgi:hypothetical protein